MKAKLTKFQVEQATTQVGALPVYHSVQKQL